MKGSKGALSDLVEPFEITVNQEIVPAINWSGKQWFQMGPLFKALGFHETIFYISASEASRLFLDSGEFRPFKNYDSWFGTIAGLHKYANYLRKCQSSRRKPQDRKAAGILFRSLMKWLLDVSNTHYDDIGKT